MGVNLAQSWKDVRLIKNTGTVLIVGMLDLGKVTRRRVLAIPLTAVEHVECSYDTEPRSLEGVKRDVVLFLVTGNYCKLDNVTPEEIASWNLGSGAAGSEWMHDFNRVFPGMPALLPPD